MPLVNRTRAIFLRAEFGFFGDTVRTIRQTPRLNGFPLRAGAVLFFLIRLRPRRTNWLMVGNVPSGKAFGVWRLAFGISQRPRPTAQRPHKQKTPLTEG